MKISKVIAICGVLFVSALSAGCLNGPIAEFGGTLLPGGINPGSSQNN
mgnify:CR=1 FL=1